MMPLFTASSPINQLDTYAANVFRNIEYIDREYQKAICQPR
jgi:hypothetical protein